MVTETPVREPQTPQVVPMPYVPMEPEHVCPSQIDKVIRRIGPYISWT